MSITKKKFNGIKGSLYYRLWKNIPSSRKKQLFILLFLTIFSAMTEVIAIGSLIPLLTLISDPQALLKYSFFVDISERYEISNPNDLVYPIIIFFILIMIFTSLFRIFLVWYQTRFSHTTGSELASIVFKKTLFQPYSSHLERNSSEIISAVVVKTNQVVGGIISPIVGIFTQLFIAISISSALIYLSPEIVIAGVLILGSTYTVILLIFKPILLKNSLINSEGSIKIVKIVQEALGGIRDLIIDGYLNRATKHYTEVDLKTRLAQANSHVLSLSPRYIVETIGIIAFIIIAVIISLEDGGLGAKLPILGAFAIGLQRLLPILQQIYAHFSTILACRESLKDVVELLEQTIPKDTEIKKTIDNLFLRSIKLSNVTYKYATADLNSINKLNLEIKKGSKIGIVGPSGSGKSTLMDLLMGLLQPSAGSIFIDDLDLSGNSLKNWQDLISHVPQNVFLADSSIAENIALGKKLDEIDFKRMEEVIQKVELQDYVAKLPNGLLTMAGEQGSKMSGGQRQRIGIARALYKNTQVLFLDEATSALDEDTESRIIEAIKAISHDMTIFAVSHKIQALSFCEHIIVMDDGKLNETLSYNEFIKSRKLS